MYQIIPRKYRPQSFKKIVGQDAIVATLKNALQRHLLAQAYLFCGGKGTGKTTLARLFAKALNCAHLTEEQEPCNACSSCLEIASGRSLDVLEIDGASNRGIDDIRQINDTVAYAPSSGKYKIYLIDEVHMLTKEAFNALLKTLEEPPQHVKFFFATTEPHKVLPTIISRCQRFDLNRITKEAMKEKLIWIVQDLQVAITDDALHKLVALSEGSLRDAESLLDQLICFAKENTITEETLLATFGLTPQAVYDKLDHAIVSSDLGFAYQLAEEVFSSGKDLSAFMDGLVGHYRNHLKQSIQEKAAKPFSTEQCLYIIEYLIEWGPKLAKTCFKQTGLEIVLLHLIRSHQRVSVDSLVHRLLQLENGLHQNMLKESKNTKPSQDLQLTQEPLYTDKTQESVAHSEENKEPSNNAVSSRCEIIINPPTTAVAQIPATATLKSSLKSRYETLVRFAAVELEGITQR